MPLSLRRGTVTAIVEELDGLAREPGIRYVLALQEAVAVSMADGYAQASGGIGAVNVHVSPGLGNAMGMLYDAQKAGAPMTIKIYPGAYHSFDSANPVRFVETRVNASSPTGRGATTGGDPEAWADSIREVVAFFGRNLK